VLKIIQKNLVLYDKKGENHYDIISAFIKSLRGSDPNGAVYWMARMLSAGEDPLFIARRMIILASEDIGNANPNALMLANNCFQAVHHIGMPEARIVLSQTATYLASSPKSNAAYMAIEEAIAWVEKTGDLPVPLHLRNAPTKLMKEIGYGKAYQYAHAYENNFVEQEFLPTSISGLKFYDPQNNPRENELRKYLKNCWKDKYKYVLLLLIGLFSLLFDTHSQDWHYSQYYTSPLNINPALTGSFDGTFRASVNQKTQWMAVSAPYVTFSAGFDAQVFKSDVYRFLLGIGVNFNYDQAGDSKYTSLHPILSISLIKSLDRRNRNKLAFGFYGGLVHRSINYATLFFDEQYQNGIFDPSNPISESFGRESFNFFDCGIGAIYSFAPSKKFSMSVGVSGAHLNRPDQSLYQNKIPLGIKIIPLISFNIRLTDECTLSPMAFGAFQNQYREIVFGSNVSYLLSKRTYQDQLLVGGGIHYRWKDAFILTGFLEWNHLRFGFSYDINSSSLAHATQARGGFEFSIIYIYKRKMAQRLKNNPCPYEIM
jgi:type IX secretion system PorP/SprF family membrane protein